MKHRWLCYAPDYPGVRSVLSCMACADDKEAGLVLCWPCHRKYKREGYPQSLVDKLQQAEARIALYHRFGRKEQT